MDTDLAARRTLESVLNMAIKEASPLLLVDSPPGAGKTRLIEDITLVAVRHAKMSLGIIAPRAEQTFDIVRRLLRLNAEIDIQILQPDDRGLPQDLTAVASLRPPVSKVAHLQRGVGVVVGTAAKFYLSVLDFGDNYFDALVCDEAYQLSYADFAPLFSIAQQTILVGDPGQLPPLVSTDTSYFEAAPNKIHWPVPTELRRRFPTVPVMRLPVTRRFAQDTVDFVQPSLYPELPFTSALDGSDRLLRFENSGVIRHIDRALDMLAEGNTIVGLLLPRKEGMLGDVDEELCELMTEITVQIVRRRPSWAMQRLLTARDIGCIDAHVTSVAATQRRLRQVEGMQPDVMVNTPEIWQGLERPITIVKHPLSGLSRLDEFALEPGRFCVMLTRHQLGCILVARDGIGDALASHNHDCAGRHLGAPNAEWHGWEAHNYIWRLLEERNRLIRI